MRVLMTADAAGGVWTYVRELCDGLSLLGVEVVVAGMGPKPREELGVATHWGPYALEWMHEPWEEVARAGEWLLELREEVEPDLVHVNGFVHAALRWRTPVIAVAHSDVWSWWAAVRGAAPPAEWERYREEVEHGLQAADVVVSPTHAQLESLARHYRFETETLVIPNGRSPLTATEKEPLVVGIGRAWDEAKNLAALERLALPWPVELADGSRPRREVEQLLARAAIFAEPARYEPFGFSALEAASAGCALVLGDIASLREVWDDAAVYVDPRDDGELERALRRLIEDEPLSRELAEAAMARSRRYSPERTAEAYLSLYERLPQRVG